VFEPTWHLCLKEKFTRLEVFPCDCSGKLFFELLMLGSVCPFYSLSKDVLLFRDWLRFSWVELAGVFLSNVKVNFCFKCTIFLWCFQSYGSVICRFYLINVCVVTICVCRSEFSFIRYLVVICCRTDNQEWSFTKTSKVVCITFKILSAHLSPSFVISRPQL